MGFVGFVSWFAAGIIIISLVDVMISNSFITAFIAGSMMGVLGARET